MPASQSFHSNNMISLLKSREEADISFNPWRESISSSQDDCSCQCTAMHPSSQILMMASSWIHHQRYYILADCILFADAQSCALLKEYAISFFVAHHKEVLKSKHSQCLMQSSKLLTEMISDILLLAGPDKYNI